MKKMFSLFLAFIFISCSNPYKLSKKDISYLNHVVDSLHKVDQGNRAYRNKIDSIYGLRNLPIRERISTKSQKELLGDKYKNYKKSMDSGWAVTRANDVLNSNMLISLTKEYGFPSMKRLEVPYARAYLIFVHTPKEYRPEVKSLIEYEFAENRISEYEKEYIFWHLNGRNGMPPRVGENGVVILNEKLDN